MLLEQPRSSQQSFINKGIPITIVHLFRRMPAAGDMQLRANADACLASVAIVEACEDMVRLLLTYTFLYTNRRRS